MRWAISPTCCDKAFVEKHLFFHHFACLLRADHPLITATTLSLAQFLSVEHAVVSGAGRTYEIFERYSAIEEDPAAGRAGHAALHDDLRS